MAKFLSNYAYSTVKKPVITEFAELTEKKYKSSSLCGPKSTSVCVLVFLTNDNAGLLEDLKPVINFFQDDSVNFAYVDAAKEP